ncbi:MAG TPA: type II toxin-antitoxin system Phd/YefM family antitoxin [bacterium]|nr:type II toxin-antitoxin system Phd/YefM family antitoxin [bacterium]HPN42468.1 type II toxin-antitoxin system Phd/YefM family antitoxin [bacterium]
MIIHPQIIEKQGKKEYVILPYEEFLLIQEELDDLNDLHDLRVEKEISKDEPTRKLEDVIKDLNI